MRTHAVWHTVATALVEASEERWVRLMSKSLYLHHSRQQLCSMARVKRRERKNASNTESEASFKRPVLLSSSPDRGASQKAARNSDLERRSFLASDPIVLTTHRPTKRLPLCSTHKGTTVSLFSYSTHKCALLLHPELRRWWWDWGGGDTPIEGKQHVGTIHFRKGIVYMRRTRAGLKVGNG